MEPDRQEVYERIPWEHLDKRANDRQWLYVGLAGVVALGVLAYSFVQNRPVEPEAASQPIATTPATLAATVAPEPTSSSPVVVAEADLYAVDTSRLEAAAAAHAEWFAVEYFSVDGSDESAVALTSLLPEGVPLPEAPEGTQVFVDWAGTHSLTEIGSFEYEVDVLVRSLMSTGESGFIRQPVRMIRVPIGLGSDGLPRVLAAPQMVEVPSSPRSTLELVEAPVEVLDYLPAGSAVVGGMPLPDGRWQILLMVQGSDGVRRPVVQETP